MTFRLPSRAWSSATVSSGPTRPPRARMRGRRNGPARSWSPPGMSTARSAQSSRRSPIWNRTILETAIELPAAVSRALGLDGGRHWLKADELNRFTWPGYDLRPIPGRKGDHAYGMLPLPIFEALRSKILARRQAGKGRSLDRD